MNSSAFFLIILFASVVPIKQSVRKLLWGEQFISWKFIIAEWLVLIAATTILMLRIIDHHNQ
jgi:hypothetical protein